MYAALTAVGAPRSVQLCSLLIRHGGFGKQQRNPERREGSAISRERIPYLRELTESRDGLSIMEEAIDAIATTHRMTRYVKRRPSAWAASLSFLFPAVCDRQEQRRCISGIQTSM